MRNKFSSLQQTVLSKTDIFSLSETKIDDSFPDSQFSAEGFKVYRKDRTKSGEGLLLYVNENLALSLFIPIYESFVLLDNFNMSTENSNLKNIMYSFDLDNLIDLLTSYKLIDPTRIDLILANKKKHIMKSATFETDLSDHHKLTTTILRKTHK